MANNAAYYRAELERAAPPADGLWYRPGEDGHRLCTALRLAELRESKREKLLREAARDIPLMRENIAAGYMPEASQAVIDEYQRQLAAPTRI